MPDVIKRGRFVHSEDVVVIPGGPGNNAIIDDEGGQADNTSDLPGAAPQNEVHNAREEAEAIARRLIEDAGAERDSILRQANDEAARILESAQSEGYEAGRRYAADDAAAAISQLRDLIDELTQRQSDYFVHYERELKYLSLDVARKIMGSAIEADETAIADLIRQAVSSVKGAQWITLELSQRSERLIKLLQKEFASHSTKQIEIITKDISDDSCIIKTNIGNVDASVATQLESLRKIFEEMDAPSL